MKYSNIYTITNNKTNKKYVGQSTNVQKRWNRHKSSARHGGSTYIHNAMRKHGIDNFTIDVIEEKIPLSDINDREMYWIEKLDTLSPNGYNLTIGGDGCHGYTHSDKTKKLISRRIKETYEKRGYAHTEESKALISKSAKERYKNMTKEEKADFVGRLGTDGYDLDKMNDGYKKWRESVSDEDLESIYKKVVQTKKEKGYDFYNFSFGKMTPDEKSAMYEKISKNNPRSTAILMLCDNDTVKKEFHSIGEAARYLNKEYGYSLNSKNNIRAKLDTGKKAYGYIWNRK